MPPQPAPPPGPPPFRYADLLPADRGWLLDLTDAVIGLAYRTACDLVRIGLRLAEARSRLKRRTFKRWAAAALPWGRSHTYRLIAVAAAFGPHLSQIGTYNIDPAALYVLAQPQVSPAARAHAVALAAGGARITHAGALEVLAAHRRAPEPTRKELAAHDARMREFARAERAVGAETSRPVPAPADVALAWAALAELAVAGAVHVGATAEHDDEPLYAVTAGGRCFVRRRLSDAVLAAAGREPQKHCTTCDETKAASLFGDNADLPDGRNKACKECERGRLKDFKRRKKAGKPAA